MRFNGWGVAPLGAALLLAGCGGKTADIPDSWLSIIENESAAPIAPPAECRTKGDPKWTVPPEGNELMADTARRERKNKDAFGELAARRRVCAAGLPQQGGK
jgi:hypothetical protein